MNEQEKQAYEDGYSEGFEKGVKTAKYWLMEIKKDFIKIKNFNIEKIDGIIDCMDVLDD